MTQSPKTITRRRFRPLSSIGSKITVILIAMGLASALTAWISTVVFSRIVGEMDHLSTTMLPKLELNNDLVTAASETKNVLTDALLAGDLDSLEESHVAIVEMNNRFDALIAQLPEAERAEFSQDAATAAAALSELVQKRQSANRNLDWIETQSRELRTLSETLQGALAEVADAAYFNVAIGAEETMGSVNATLTDLVDRQFAGLQLLLEARAEINLLSGVTLAAGTTSDQSTLSILKDLTLGSRNAMRDVLTRLETNDAVTIDLDVIRAALETFERAERAGATMRSDVLRMRQEASAELASSVDDMVFDLTIASEDAATENSETIQKLLDNEVEPLNRLVDLNGWVSAFQVSALAVVVAPSIAEAERAGADLRAVADELVSQSENFDATLADKLAPIIALADLESGLPAFKIASLQADASVRAEAIATADAVQFMSKRTASLGEAQITAIGDMAAGILDDVTEVEDKMTWLIGGSAGVFVLALMLTRLLIVRPLNAISRTTEQLAEGDRSPVTGFDRASTEIHRIALALAVFRDGLVEKDELAEATEVERRARQDEQNAAVEAIGAGLASLSKGDLTTRIEIEMHDGYAILRNDFNTTLDILQKTMSEMVSASGSIRNGSGEISQAATDLSRRTEHQASTLEETAAALDELTSSVRTAAQVVRDVEQTVQGAQSDAKNSESVVQDAVGSMNEISKSSSAISKIVSVIDDIAFQTNLLALNAGVEAARAGDAGKGFAVVAAEVRALAQRSSDSAMEIKSLIDNSASQVEGGVELVGKAGKALHATLERFGDISELISGIAETASEQASSLDQINVGMTQIDKVTQQNAAMVEETTAASVELNKDSEALSQLIGHFNIGRRAGTSDRVKPRENGGNRATIATLAVETKDASTWEDQSPVKAPLAKEPRAPIAKAVGSDDELWAEF